MNTISTVALVSASLLCGTAFGADVIDGGVTMPTQAGVFGVNAPAEGERAGGFCDAVKSAPSLTTLLCEPTPVDSSGRA